MASIRKNVASQNVTFCMVSATTGAADASASVTVYITKDNGSQATGGGTVTNAGHGQYNYAPTQAETNATDVGFLFTASGDIPVNYDFHTDVVDTNGYPSVNVADINAVSTSSVTTVNAYIGTTVNPLFDSNSGIKADVIDWLGTAVTAATGGIPDVNAKNINNVSTGSVTTINANIGTTQAIVFDGNNFQKVDLVDIAGNALSTSSAQIGVNLVNIAGSAVSTSSAQLGVNAVNIAGQAAQLDGNNLLKVDVADWGGTATSGAIPPDVVFIRSGTAQAGGNSTITLDSGASATNNFYQNEIVFIRGGTGAGQSAIIASYVGSTKVATIVGTWATNPDSTSTFTILPFGSITATISGSVNVSSINNVSCSSVTTVNANIGTTSAITFDGNGYTKVDLVDIAGSAVSASTAQLGVNVVNFGGHAGTFPANGIPSVDVTTIDSQTANAAGAVTFPGTIASTTNITAGTITTVTNLTNAATSGDFTATMKTSIGTAVAASAVASVTGNVGGSVGSINGVTFPSNFSSLAIDGSGDVTYNNAAPPTTAQIADKVLGRNIAGGSDGGRSVSEAFFVLRNKVSISGTTMTVYSTDDVTTSWQSTLTANPSAEPITASAPTS